MRIQNKKTGKTVACVLAAALLCTGMNAVAYGAGRESSREDTAAAAQTASELSEQGKDTLSTDTKDRRDETVYVFADADGSVQKVIAGDWLQKAEGGDEYALTQSDSELPVTMTVTYTLDGRAITPTETVGSTGHLVIRYDYVNNSSEKVQIGGKQEKVYTPFAVLTGMLFDSEKVTNAQIENGKLINDGSHMIAVGIALPGLGESLGIEKENADKIPNYVEFSADVTDFELESTYTVVTNEVFRLSDSAELDRFDDLGDDIDELNDAMQRLMDGSDQLFEGIATLDEKSGELVTGVNQLYDGSAQLKDGADTLKNGADSLKSGVDSLKNGVDELAGGAGSLVSGLSTLKSSNDTLNAGAKQVFDTLLGTAAGQLRAAGLEVGELTTDNYGDVLNGLLAALDADSVYNMAYEQARQTVTQAVEAQRDDIEAQVRQGVETQVRTQALEGVLQAVTVQYPEYGLPATIAEYQAAVEAGLIPETLQGMIEQAVEEQMADCRETIDTNTAAITEQKIQEAIASNMASDEVKQQIEAAVSRAGEGAAQIAGLKTQLDSYNTFYQGLLAYTAGVSQAGDGADQLKEGVSRLQSGASQLQSGASQLADGADSLASGAGDLKNGIASLKEGSTVLTDGVGQLKDGAGELRDGLKQFDEEGIRKLTDVLQGNLQELVDRVQAVLDMSKDYRPVNATGNENGSVRFIYKTAKLR